MKQQNSVFADENTDLKSHIMEVFENFDNEGTMIGEDKRNTIKWVKSNGRLLNFKSFKKPNQFNRLVYQYFRKSKARRSFEYAHLLLRNNFYTPAPIAYMETYDILGLSKSFYVSEQLEDSWTLREILNRSTAEEKAKVLGAYTVLMYQLHERGIEFIDNTAGNFLVRPENNAYRFYLVDLNRMNFHCVMGQSRRLRNLSRLSNDPQIIETIGIHYARLAGWAEEYCYKKMKVFAKRRNFGRDSKRILKSIAKGKAIR